MINNNIPVAATFSVAASAAEPALSRLGADFGKVVKLVKLVDAGARRDSPVRFGRGL